MQLVGVIFSRASHNRLQSNKVCREANTIILQATFLHAASRLKKEHPFCKYPKWITKSALSLTPTLLRTAIMQFLLTQHYHYTENIVLILLRLVFLQKNCTTGLTKMNTKYKFLVNLNWSCFSCQLI